MKVNFKNLAENLIIIITVSITVGFVVNRTTTNTMEKALESQKELIQQAIDKNTSEISNTFQNEFKKVKNKKGEPINIVIDPSTNSVISNADTSQVIEVKKEKGFFKRWRNKK